MRRFLPLTILVLAGCSTISAFKSPSGDYHRYVDNHLKQQRIFDRGRELLVVKVLPVTPTLRAEQHDLTPVDSVPLKQGVRQVVMALNVPNRDPALLPDWEFRLGGRKASGYLEIQDDEVIEREYYFAYPFYRVFVVDFPEPEATPGSNVENFEVYSPFGKVMIACDFADSGTMPESAPTSSAFPVPGAE